MNFAIAIHPYDLSTILSDPSVFDVTLRKPQYTGDVSVIQIGGKLYVPTTAVPPVTPEGIKRLQDSLEAVPDIRIQIERHYGKLFKPVNKKDVV